MARNAGAACFFVCVFVCLFVFELGISVVVVSCFFWFLSFSFPVFFSLCFFFAGPRSPRP